MWNNMWLKIIDNPGNVERIVKVERVDRKNDMIYFYNFYFNKIKNIKILGEVKKPVVVDTNWFALYGRHIDYRYQYGRRESGNVIYVNQVEAEDSTTGSIKFFIKMDSGSKFFSDEIILLDVGESVISKEPKYQIDPLLGRHFTNYHPLDMYTNNAIVSQFMLWFWREGVNLVDVTYHDLPKFVKEHFALAPTEKMDIFDFIPELFKFKRV